MGNRSGVRPGSAPWTPSNGGSLQIFIVVGKLFQFGKFTLDIFQSKDRESLWVEIVKGVFESYDQSTTQNILYLNTAWDK